MTTLRWREYLHCFGYRDRTAALFVVESLTKRDRSDGWEAMAPLRRTLLPGLRKQITDRATSNILHGLLHTAALRSRRFRRRHSCRFFEMRTQRRERPRPVVIELDLGVIFVSPQNGAVAVLRLTDAIARCKQSH